MIDLDDEYSRFLVRLSFHFSEPLHKLLRWPNWVVEVYQKFLLKEPTVEERIEHAFAHMQFYYYSANAPPRSAPKTVNDFLHYRNAWSNDQEELDKLILAELEQERTL